MEGSWPTCTKLLGPTESSLNGTTMVAKEMGGLPWAHRSNIYRPLRFAPQAIGSASRPRASLLFCLLAIEVKRLHHRRVGKAEQEGGAVAGVDVLVEGPSRHRKHVLVLPVQLLAAHQ
jgi:hypothetical protein